MNHCLLIVLFMDFDTLLIALH